MRGFLLLLLIAPAVAASPPASEGDPALFMKDLTPLQLPEPTPLAEQDVRDLIPPPLEHHNGGFYGSAEYLLLRPRRGAADYAIRDGNRDLVPSGALQTLKYDLSSGLRAELGYRFDHTMWDVATSYSFLRSGGDRRIGVGATGTIYPTLTRPGLTDEAEAAKVHGELAYDIFDIAVGRRTAIDDQLSVRVFGGGRFAHIRQNLDAVYHGRDANDARVRTLSSFDGFGPMIGGEATWGQWRGFHLYARASGGLLSGQVPNSIRETNNAGQTLYADLTSDTRRVVPTASIGIGGGWQYRTLSIRGGYEVTHYFGLIEQPRFTNDFAEGKVTTRTADFSLEGFFLQFGLSF